MEEMPVTKVKSTSEQLNPVENDEGPRVENVVPHESTDGVVESNLEMNEEDARSILEVIASTGKYWHEWDRLKSVLSFQLKQVLSEYAEAKMTTEEQIASLGETYPELVNRLDEAINNFYEGPPFTLQRLCEILLDSRSIYTSLSKLALALEKNLLVTSMLTKSTDPYPQAIKRLDETKTEEGPKSNSVQNGGEPKVENKDEEMAEVEETEMNDNMTIDV